MKVASSIIALCLSVIFVSPSLSASPETLLIGKWKSESGDKIEFVTGGTLIVKDQGAKYRIVDKERIEFDLGVTGWFSELGPRPILRFTVSKDELTLIPLAKPNKPEIFRRIKVDAAGNDAETYFIKAIENVDRGNYQEGIRDSDRGIDLDPKYAMAYNNRGFAYVKLGNYQRGLKDYSKAIELDPKQPLFYRNRGGIFNRIGNFQEAIKDFDKAIELDQKNGLTYFQRGISYARVGNFQQSIKDFSKTIEIGPKNLLARAYSARGITNSRLGNFQQAIKDCDKAIELNPKYPGGYSYRGVVQARAGNFDEAIKDCEKAITIDPKESWSYCNMAIIYSLQKNPAMACQALKNAIEKGYSDWHYLKVEKYFDNVRNSSCFREIIRER